MELIQKPLPISPQRLPRVALRVDRHTLAKRRWRGVADDGCEFSFDLDHPLKDGVAFFENKSRCYVIVQKPEQILELRIADCGLRNATDATRIGWVIGNLHFPLEINGEKIRVADDSALRQLFEREHWPFAVCEAVFHPLSGGHHH